MHIIMYKISFLLYVVSKKMVNYQQLSNQSDRNGIESDSKSGPSIRGKSEN